MMSHTPIDKSASSPPYLVLTNEESIFLIRSGATDKIKFGDWWNEPHCVTDPAIIATILEHRNKPHRDTTCPKCDGDGYDDAAGYCEECGFEGFDGDQDGDAGDGGGD